MRPVLISVTQQGTVFVMFSGIHSPSVFEHGLGSITISGSVRCGNIAITKAAPPVELDLRRWCGTLFQPPHGFPDRVHNLLEWAQRRLAHHWSAILEVCPPAGEIP